MKEDVKRIKEKVKKLPSLSLPQGTRDLVIETDASNKARGGVLIEKHGDREEIYGFSLRSFNNT